MDPGVSKGGWVWESIIPANTTEIVFKDMAYVQNGDMFGENDHSEDESGENYHSNVWFTHVL